MDVDWLLIASAAQFHDDALRLAQRIGADQYAAPRLGAQAMEQPVDLAASVGMTKHRQAERRVADEYVAGRHDEGRAGRIGPALIVARDDHSLAAILEDNLRRAQHMTGGHKADRDLAQANALAI